MRSRSRLQLLLVVATLLATLASPRLARAADLELQPGTKIVFATKDEAAKRLVEKDEFVQALSPFDRSSRLKTDKDVSEKEYLDFVAAQTLDWTDDEKKRVTGLVADLNAKVTPLKLSLPAVITLVKTTGLEEGNAAYCRAPSIVLPKSVIEKPRMLASVLPHELFHVYSTHNRKLRPALYKIVGFTTGAAVALPASLTKRKITNPDAPGLDVTIEVKKGSERVTAVPILYSRTESYDTKKGGEFFEYLEFRLMVVVKGKDGALEPVLDSKQEPTLLKIEETPDYLEQVGKNTGYTIHPDEILADNFSLLLNASTRKKELPSPAIVEGLKKFLAENATK